MKKLSNEKQNLLRKRLIQDVSIREIANELQISETTVKRYKKMMPVVQINDDDIKKDCISRVNKLEEKYTVKIQKELDLFEDEEEGWTYHLTKSDLRRKQSGLWWNVIVYPESAPAGWVETLRARGYSFAISPLHDKDVWGHDSPRMINHETGEIIEKGAKYKVGDRKKAHWHMIVILDKKVHYMEINRELQEILHCPYIQKCRSLKNSYEYFLHINHPERYQKYDKDEIQIYNNFHIEPNNYEKGVLQNELLNTIIDENLDTWLKVVEHYRDQIEYIMLLANRPGCVTATINALWRKNHPVENKIKYVRCLDKQEEMQMIESINNKDKESEDI